MIDTTQIRFNADGLVPAIIQDDQNGEVLMLAWMNEEALRRTLDTRRVTYWSRSRQAYWVKGETSGHIQQLQSAYFDCDKDCLLLRVLQTQAACHEGYRSCFFRRIDEGDEPQVIAEPLTGAY